MKRVVIGTQPITHPRICIILFTQDRNRRAAQLWLLKIVVECTRAGKPGRNFPLTRVELRVHECNTVR